MGSPTSRSGLALIKVRNLSGNNVVAIEDFADLVSGDGTFATDAPVVATEFDDGGRHDTVGVTGIEDERDAIAELTEHFVAAFAGAGARKIGTGAGQRHTEFRDEIVDNFMFGPTQRYATGVRRDFEGKAVRRVDDDGQRTGPAGLREAVEIVGKIFR